MADTKTSGLTETTTVKDTDINHIVTGVATTPLSQFVEVGNNGKYPSLDLLSLLADDTQLVSTNIIQTLFDGTTFNQGGANNDTRTFLITSSLGRIRQEGTVEKIECRAGTGAFTNVTSLKVQVWRKDSGGLYDRIGESEDIQSIFSGASDDDVLTKTLTSPIQNVKAGDYMAVEVVSTGDSSNLFKAWDGTGSHQRLIDGVIGATNIDFDAGTSNDNIALFRCYMKAPWAVYVGSSYGESGQGGFFVHQVTAIDTSKQIPYKLQDALGRSFQNNSRGSTNTAALLVTETNERVKDFKPKVVFLEIGTNDIGTTPTPTTVATFKADYITAIDDIISDGIKCVCIGVSPRDNSSVEITQTKEEYNEAIRDIVLNRRSDTVFVDMDNGFGQIKADVTKFNRTEILTILDSGDGVHYTDQGWALMAKRILSGVFGEAINVPLLDSSNNATYIKIDANGTGNAITNIDVADLNTTGTPDGTLFLRDDFQWTAVPGGGDALVANPLSQFAATTSLQLLGVISGETGTGALVFGTSPTLVTPALGTPSALVGTNITGTASGLTAGTVTTNANLTGDVTSVGNAATIAAKAVDVAMLADGTDGELITWDTSGVAATVAVGTINHVLTSNGIGAAPTFQAASQTDKRTLFSYNMIRISSYTTYSAQYGPTLGGDNFNSYSNTTESTNGFRYTTDWGITIKRVYVLLRTNTMNGSSVMGIRDDGATVASVTISASSGGGEFDSGDVTVNIASGSLVNVIWDTTASSSGGMGYPLMHSWGYET